MYFPVCLTIYYKHITLMSTQREKFQNASHDIYSHYGQ